MNNKICVLGNDERSEYLRKFYEKENKSENSIENAQFVIMPIPFTTDMIYINNTNIKIEDFIKDIKKYPSKIIICGAISNEVKEIFVNNSITFIDIMKKESLAIKNAIATAEGALMYILQHTKFTISGSEILILGYGRIAKAMRKNFTKF